MTEEEAKSVIDKIRKEIKDYFQKYNLKYAIFGKSEGLDSSVITGLLSGIPEIRPIGVIMPIESKPETEKIAKIVLDYYKIPYLKIDLTDQYLNLKNKLNILELNKIAKTIGEREKYALGNIKARLRMITLYHIAQMTNGIVVSTDNYSEYWTGFWTLNGDVGDIAPIQQLFKGLELYTIAKALGVPKESLEAVPSDGLGVTPNSQDKDQLLLDYPDLDREIIKFVNTGVCDKRIANIINKTEYKRNWPKVITREDLGLKSIYEL